jgi:DNA-binding TFAR19-related protein (PDSD5 family)
MRWFLDLSMRTKLLVGYGLLVVFIAVVTITAYLGMAALQASQRSLYEHEYIIAVDLEDLRSNQDAIRATALMMMLLTERSEQEVQHQRIKELSNENEAIMRRLLERGHHDPQLLRRLEEFDIIRRAFRETRETQVMPLIYAGKIDEAKGLFLGIQAERNNKMEAIADAFVDEAKESARTALTPSEARMLQSVRIFALIGALALLISVAMASPLNRIIAKPPKPDGVSGHEYRAPQRAESSDWRDHCAVIGYFSNLHESVT